MEEIIKLTGKVELKRTGTRHKTTGEYSLNYDGERVDRLIISSSKENVVEAWVPEEHDGTLTITNGVNSFTLSSDQSIQDITQILYDHYNELSVDDRKISIEWYNIDNCSYFFLARVSKIRRIKKNHGGFISKHTSSKKNINGYGQG